ncbi:hypothetical protein PG993_000246 [Apiospora rasikravindrae]|uniref:Uncharacterized protein n=1 Tax=Apiospora rasikravindrae TaxID=990691 RepID=A0ABR1U7Z8_9PEZI
MQSLHDSIVLPKVRNARPRRSTPSDITSLPTSRGGNTTTTKKKTSPYLHNFIENVAMAKDRKTSPPTTSSARRDYNHSSRHSHHSSSHQQHQIPTSPSSSIMADFARRSGIDTSGKPQRKASPPHRQRRGRSSSPSPAAVPLPPSTFHQGSHLPPTSRRDVPAINVQPPTTHQQHSDSSSSSTRPRSSHNGDRRRRPRRHHRRRSRSDSESSRHLSPGAAAGPASAAAGPSRDNNNNAPSSSSFHAGLQDILQGVFGHGAAGPTEAEMKKLADDLGSLIEGALLDRLVAELRAGLLEKLLIEYLEELVAGVITKGIDRAVDKKHKGGKSGKGEGGAGGASSDDWKKTALRKAVGMLLVRFTNKSSSRAA